MKDPTKYRIEGYYRMADELIFFSDNTFDTAPVYDTFNGYDYISVCDESNDLLVEFEGDGAEQDLLEWIAEG